MANIIDLLTDGQIIIAVVDADPSQGLGLTAAIGSLALYSTGTIGHLFLKTGSADTAWTENPTVPINLATQVSGILPVANGGTNLSTTPSNGQLLIGNGSGYALTTLTGGKDISITNGTGTITIASTFDSTVSVDSVSTTDATVTTIKTVAIPTGSVVWIETTILGYRTGGTGTGATGDSAVYIRNLRIKCPATTPTIATTQSDFTSSDNHGFSNPSFSISGQNILIQVTGAANTNVDWKAETLVRTLS